MHFRSYLFRPQSKDIQDCGGYQTVAVDMVVTGERIILLDTQVSVHNPSVCVFVCVCVCRGVASPQVMEGHTHSPRPHTHSYNTCKTKANDPMTG